MRIDILSTIWKRSPGGFIFLPAKDSLSGEWHEREAFPKRSAESHLRQLRDHDVYFSPGTYLEPTARKIENHAALGVLYADLDDEFNRDRLNTLPPSLLMETSHGMYQAVWLLNRPLEVSAAADLNKRLSYHLEADFGSWIITKVLRIPESMNWKRGGQRVEVVRWDDRIIWDPDSLATILPALPQPTLAIDNPHPKLPTSAQAKATLNLLWPRLDHRTKELLAVHMPADRSLHLARLAKRLASLKLTPEEVFTLLYNLPANKFRSRPELLWESIVLTAYI